MTHGAHAAHAAHAAAVVQAIKASGAIVRVEPDAFVHLVSQQDDPLVIHALAGVFKKRHAYLVAHRGFCFHAQSPDPLPLPGRTQLVEAKEIWVPG